MKDTMTYKETAQRLGVCIHTVRKLVEDGELVSIRISPRRILIPIKAYEAFLEQRLVNKEG